MAASDESGLSTHISLNFSTGSCVVGKFHKSVHRGMHIAEESNDNKQKSFERRKEIQVWK